MADACRVEAPATKIHRSDARLRETDPFLRLRIRNSRPVRLRRRIRRPAAERLPPPLLRRLLRLLLRRDLPSVRRSEQEGPEPACVPGPGGAPAERGFLRRHIRGWRGSTVEIEIEVELVVCAEFGGSESTRRVGRGRCRVLFVRFQAQVSSTRNVTVLRIRVGTESTIWYFELCAMSDLALSEKDGGWG